MTNYATDCISTVPEAELVVAQEPDMIHKGDYTKIERVEMRVIRWMCGVAMRERQTSNSTSWED